MNSSTAYLLKGKQELFKFLVGEMRKRLLCTEYSIVSGSNARDNQARKGIRAKSGGVWRFATSVKSKR